MTPPWMNLYALVVVGTPLASIVGVNEAMTLTGLGGVAGLLCGWLLAITVCALVPGLAMKIPL